ncbi:uncharacterized protein [Physcomitrium patens]|uniref:KOW domain-containing protein n=1 Tax=Physcomitrium patens TaxID=3218 RepID=A9T8H7_PHYPA|nr:uncharacterized protein LOC112275999 [Physcomitrium patens]PNR59761.1 hypothetical protein PHYPA_002553 [Physcomitrium patens]|eukprot:XP_024362674.1 uncharacterized protein LOC112275999 [Physcomitrella patens]
MGYKAAVKVFKQWKILRGDKVMLMAGKDAGLTGTVMKVIRSQNRVIVEGRNLVKKHIKRTEGNPGGIITMEAPLHVSNVQLVDPVNGAPCRVAYRFLEDGTKVRVSTGGSASGSIIPRPAILLERRKPRPTIAGLKDTSKEVVLERTIGTVEGKPGLPQLLN